MPNGTKIKLVKSGWISEKINTFIPKRDGYLGKFLLFLFLDGGWIVTKTFNTEKPIIIRDAPKESPID